MRPEDLALTEFVAEFAATTQITPPTNRAKFYRAVVKDPPLRLLAITETNQTIRGTVDKGWDNITLTFNGMTTTGWCYGTTWLWASNAQGRRISKPIGEHSHFTFRRLPITNTTPALLTIRDDDGYVLQTNLFIGPGPFINLLPKHLQPKTNAAISPAGQEPPGWTLAKHSSSESLEYYSGLIACGVLKDSSDGWWDGSASMRNITTMTCRNRRTEVCEATYIGVNGQAMELTGWTDGCAFGSNRQYSAWTEIGSYDSNSKQTEARTRGRASRLARPGIR